MARELKNSRWDDYGRKKLSAEVKYPWDQWLNGSMWYLVKGEDFDVDTKGFQTYIHNYANQHGIRVRTKTARNNRDLFIKARKKATDGVRRRQHFHALEERRLRQKYGKNWRDHLEHEQDEGVGGTYKPRE